jgi:hypothetical protein|tara:strand:+ start:96 stop:749 length:654 start_codon:yes stop_codon:yes gene_type:complete
MWAKVESNSVTEIYTRPKAITIGDVAATYYTAEDEIANPEHIEGTLKTPRQGTNHPANIFTLWTSSELEAIGIYEVVIDNTNIKDRKYYINTDQTYAFASDTVTASYGTATARAIADVTDEDDVVTEGLKSTHKEQINNVATGLLQKYDWYTLRAASGGTAIPSTVSTYQAAVRTKSGDMETLIDGAANVDALAALYVYNSDDPPTRPLGEWPNEPS